MGHTMLWFSGKTQRGERGQDKSDHVWPLTFMRPGDPPKRETSLPSPIITAPGCRTVGRKIQIGTLLELGFHLVTATFDKAFLRVIHRTLCAQLKTRIVPRRFRALRTTVRYLCLFVEGAVFSLSIPRLVRLQLGTLSITELVCARISFTRSRV